MSDTLLNVRKRSFFFGPNTEYHCYIHQGARGRWRWSIQDVHEDRCRALSPVRGWETEAEAINDAREFFEALDVTLTEVS